MVPSLIRVSNNSRKKSIYYAISFLIIIICVWSSLYARKTWKQCGSSLYLGEVPDIMTIGKGSECCYRNIGPLIINNDNRHVNGLIIFCSKTTLIDFYFSSNGTGIIVNKSI